MLDGSSLQRLLKTQHGADDYFPMLLCVSVLTFCGVFRFYFFHVGVLVC